MLPHFAQVSWPAPPSETTASPNGRQNAIDLAARMRAMWQ